MTGSPVQRITMDKSYGFGVSWADVLAWSGGALYLGNCDYSDSDEETGGFDIDEPLALLAMLTRELRGLSAMLADMSRGRSARDVVQANRVWGNRVQLTERALQIHNLRSIQALLERARIVDQTVKGLMVRSVWDELASLVLQFSNPRLLPGLLALT